MAVLQHPLERSEAVHLLNQLDLHYIEHLLCLCNNALWYPASDLGEADGGPGPPLILGKKESQKKEKPAEQAKKQTKQNKTAPSSLAQGLGLPLVSPFIKT